MNNSPTALRFFAFSFMFIDHFGLIFSPETLSFRLIGRFAFPLFAFMIAQGYFYTRDFYSYALRIFLLALIVQPLHLLFIHYGYFPLSSPLNVVFTLLFGLYSLHFYSERKFVLLFFLLFFSMFLDFIDFGMSYGSFGIVLVFVCYVFRSSFYGLLLSSCIVSYLGVYLGGWSSAQFFVPFAFFFLLVPLNLSFSFGRFGYWFYPLHLLFLMLIKRLSS